MITAQQFVAAVGKAAAKIREYYWGASGQDWKCDCIGLIIFALSICGFHWPGMNGTNWAERNAMKSRGPITGPGELFLGEVLYKYREPGDSRWKLPEDYKNDPDQRDYYHVGVVTSVNPLVITHCTSVEGGIKRDTSLGAWKWGGELKYVDYEGGEDMSEYWYKAIVKAENKFPVKMREEPDVNAKILQKVEQGTEVDVLAEIGTEDTGLWGFIRLEDGKTGYMMKQFLKRKEEDVGFPVTLTAEEFNEILGALEKAVEVLKKARDDYEG